MDTLNIYLEPGLVARVAAEAFDLDPARLTVPPLDGLDLPHLRAAMGAVDDELTAGGAGGRLAAESLANVLAVHLIRHVLAPRRARARAGRRAAAGAAPRRGRVHRGTPRRRPEPGADWPRSPASAPTTSPGSSRRPPGCRRTSTSSPAASSGPSSSCKPERPLSGGGRRAAPVSPIRASSPITSSASSASRRASSGYPQESPNRSQVPPRDRAASPLGFSQDGARVTRTLPVTMTGRAGRSHRCGTASSRAPSAGSALLSGLAPYAAAGRAHVSSSSIPERQA